MNVLGKFIMGGVTRIQVRYQGEEVQGCNVNLRAAQGEPFGEATPSGSISMSVHNPSAAQVFLEAPEEAAFFVTFEREEVAQVERPAEVDAESQA